MGKLKILTIHPHMSERNNLTHRILKGNMIIVRISDSYKEGKQGQRTTMTQKLKVKQPHQFYDTLTTIFVMARILK